MRKRIDSYILPHPAPLQLIHRLERVLSKVTDPRNEAGRCGIQDRRGVSTRALSQPAYGAMKMLFHLLMTRRRRRLGPVRTLFIAGFALLLGGCYIVGVNAPARHGYAYVVVASLADHTPAVGVLAAKSRHAIVEQGIASDEWGHIQAFSLTPGTHLLEVDCYRPNAVAVLHSGFDFEVDVAAGQTYVLDCAPAKVLPRPATLGAASTIRTHRGGGMPISVQPH